MDYLPEDATIEQACDWLKTKTGQTWILPRLLEFHLTPHFWLDYKPGYPAVFGDRIEGYQTHMMFAGDICRLKFDGSDALVNMFAAYDNSLIKAEPALRVPLSELRFKRESVRSLAKITKKTAHAAPPSASVVDVPKKASRQTSPEDVFYMTRAGLINAHKHEWPTIDRDLKDAFQNGLAVAKGGSRDWDEAKAVKWATSKGKLLKTSQNSLSTAFNSMSNLPSRKIVMKG